MNKDEIFLIIFLYGLVILIGSARSVLIPFLNGTRTSPVVATRSFALLKSHQKSYVRSGFHKKTMGLDPIIFHDPVSIAQKTSTVSRSTRS